MLDIKFIKENKEKVKIGVAAKQIDPQIVDDVLKFYDEWTGKLKIYEQLGQERNKIAHESKGFSEEGKNIKEKLVKAEIELQKAHQKYETMAKEIPNIPADDVKEGKDDRENEIIKEAKPKKLSFTPKDYLELGKKLDIIDIEASAKVSGARFSYLKGDAVLLEFALVQYALETLVKEGFTPILPPVLMKVPVFQKLGYSEHLGNENYYSVKGAEPEKAQGEEEAQYYLVGTSEHSVVPYFMDKTLEAADLPKRFVSFSTCFRREAGSYGKDTKGILRVHQFDKVEMISFAKPGDSEKEHELLFELEEKLFKALEIPYQVVKMCSGDLGAPAAKKYDLEAWMPGQGVFREVTSTSNCTDYQARRLNIKYKDGENSDYVHTLNGTAFAIGRTLIAILENYQQEDGSVLVPKVLQKWIGKEKVV